jgi:pimeloyl-ACP methyl ester carboxylesterase
LQVYEFAGRKGVERVAYMKSHHTFEETKGKPTVVFFPGVFQEVREFPIELAIISRVFNIPSVVVDYAALASKGIDTLGKNLPAMLQCFERDRNAPRIFIGESLGGIVAQSVAEFPGMNVKGMVLSHTIPPSELNQRLYTFLKALSKVTPVVHMAVARRIINNIVQRAEGQAHIEGEVGELSRELHEVARILKGENGALTRPRAIGFLQSAVGAVEKGRRGSKPTNFPVEVAVNRRDQVVGYVDPDTWKRHHRRVSVTTLDDPAGHSLPGMRKAEYLSNTIGPLFANVLAAA